MPNNGKVIDVQTTDLTRFNPLKADALTGDTVRPGDDIKYWTPGNPKSVHRVTIMSMPYVSEEGDLVVDVRHQDGHESTELTSTVGLSGTRKEGKWIAIAIYNDEDPADL